MINILLEPRVTTAAAEAAQVDATLADRLGRIPLDLLFPAFVSGTALLTASLIAMFKPWGPTPYGRRRTAAARNAVERSATRRPDGGGRALANTGDI